MARTTLRNNRNGGAVGVATFSPPTLRSLHSKQHHKLRPVKEITIIHARLTLQTHHLQAANMNTPHSCRTPPPTPLQGARSALAEAGEAELRACLNNYALFCEKLGLVRNEDGELEFQERDSDRILALRINIVNMFLYGPQEAPIDERESASSSPALYVWYDCRSSPLISSPAMDADSLFPEFETPTFDFDFGFENKTPRTSEEEYIEPYVDRVSRRESIKDVPEKDETPKSKSIKTAAKKILEKVNPMNSLGRRPALGFCTVM